MHPLRSIFTQRNHPNPMPFFLSPMVPPTTPLTVTGGSWPADIWRTYMGEATADLETESHEVTGWSGTPITTQDQITQTVINIR